MMEDDECGAVGGIFGKRNRSTWRNPNPVPFYPPKILNDLTRARTRAIPVGNLYLTTEQLELILHHGAISTWEQAKIMFLPIEQSKAGVPNASLTSHQKISK
jgi:hypothetical protein